MATGAGRRDRRADAANVPVPQDVHREWIPHVPHGALGGDCWIRRTYRAHSPGSGSLPQNSVPVGFLWMNPRA
jgi:hypothetical protein